MNNEQQIISQEIGNQFMARNQNAAYFHSPIYVKVQRYIILKKRN